MLLLIDIKEELYNRLFREHVAPSLADLAECYGAMSNGKPLPEHHGRLKEREVKNYESNTDCRFA